MLTRTVAPAVDPVSLVEAKAHMRVVSTMDDDSIRMYLGAAVDLLDGPTGLLGRAICTQTWAWVTPAFDSQMRLPIGQASAIVSVQYLDTAGAAQTLSSANYYLAHDALGPYLKNTPTGSWPSLIDRDDAVTITFTAGFGDAAAVPRNLKAGIMMLASHLYENREIYSETKAVPQGFSAWDLIEPYRRVL